MFADTCQRDLEDLFCPCIFMDRAPINQAKVQHGRLFYSQVLNAMRAAPLAILNISEFHALDARRIDCGAGPATQMGKIGWFQRAARNKADRSLESRTSLPNAGRAGRAIVAQPGDCAVASLLDRKAEPLALVPG
ncbi:MAG: hypothetical protein ACRECY_12575, partial [Phyllobacterium sp.]